MANRLARLLARTPYHKPQCSQLANENDSSYFSPDRISVRTRTDLFRCEHSLARPSTLRNFRIDAPHRLYPTRSRTLSLVPFLRCRIMREKDSASESDSAIAQSRPVRHPRRISIRPYFSLSLKHFPIGPCHASGLYPAYFPSRPLHRLPSLRGSKRRQAEFLSLHLLPLQSRLRNDCVCDPEQAGSCPIKRCALIKTAERAAAIGSQGTRLAILEVIEK